MNVEIRYGFEEKAYSEFELHEKFCLKRVSNQFLTFVNDQILRYSRTTSKYKFRYVGVISYVSDETQIILIILPKYYINAFLSKLDSEKKTQQILKVLRRYSSNKLVQNDFSTIGIDLYDQGTNLISLLDYLITDYLEYGLYLTNRFETEENGFGQIDWVETIESSYGYMFCKNVVYLNFKTSSVELDEYEYIRVLHKHILNEGFTFMSKLRVFEVFDYPQIDFIVDEDMLGSLEYMIKRIDDELQLQFTERSINLLKAMKAFLLKKNSKSNENIIFYGTRAFYDVWEKACAFVIGNQYEKFKALIDEPNWTKSNCFEPNRGNRLIPDILVSKKDKMFIIDAKYYDFDFDNQGVLFGKPPGVEDVVKQYAYELALKEHYLQIINILVIPSLTEHWVRFGTVSLKFFNLNDIELWHANPEDIFEKYIKNKVDYDLVDSYLGRVQIEE